MGRYKPRAILFELKANYSDMIKSVLGFLLLHGLLLVGNPQSATNPQQNP